MERSKHLAALRQKGCGGDASSARIQLAHEIRQNRDERDELLKECRHPVPHETPAADVLAMKADLVIPWKKLAKGHPWVSVPVYNGTRTF